MAEDMNTTQRITSYKDLSERSPYGEYLKEIMNFYVPLALQLPTRRKDSTFMAEEVKAEGRGGVTDIATKADKVMQDDIKMSISKLGHNWGLWEEEGEDRITEIDKTKTHTIVTDPIEGTNNFKHNLNDQWGSVIALVDNKTEKPIIGIVAHPTQRRFYVGVKDSGAYILEYHDKGELILFQVMNAEPNKSEFTYNASPHFSEDLYAQVDRFLQMGKVIKTDEKLGRSRIGIPDEKGEVFDDLESGALEVVRYKGTMYFKTSAEMAAVFVILNEIGGKVTDAFGEPWSININTLIAARNEHDYQYLKNLYDKTTK